MIALYSLVPGKIAHEDNGDTSTEVFYYSGDTLKYIIEEVNGVTTTMEIVKLSATADTSKLKVPDDFEIVN